MPESDVETVRRVYATWARGDMRAGVDLFDPDIRFESFMPDSSQRVVCHGLAEVETFMREWLAQWKDYRLFGEEFLEIGDDKVFVGGRQAGTGRQSGVSVDAPIFAVWTFRDGKVIGLVFEPTREVVLQATGLSGESGRPDRQ